MCFSAGNELLQQYWCRDIWWSVPCLRIMLGDKGNWWALSNNRALPPSAAAGSYRWPSVDQWRPPTATTADQRQKQGLPYLPLFSKRIYVSLATIVWRIIFYVSFVTIVWRIIFYISLVTIVWRIISYANNYVLL